VTKRGAPLLAGTPLPPEVWRDLYDRARRAGIPPGTRMTAELARRLLTPEERPSWPADSSTTTTRCSVS
jgi:hypothetical protein